MRNELELMELVDRYLLGELDATDRRAFEERTKENAELRELVTDQRDLHAGMQRIAARSIVQQAYGIHRWRKWKPWVIGFSVLLIAALSGFIFQRSDETTDHATFDTTEESTEIEPASTAEFEDLRDTLRETPVDTLRMILRNGKLEPHIEEEPSEVRVKQKVITIPIVGRSREELRQRIDSMQRAGVPISREGIPVETIHPDSLRKFFSGKQVPLMN